MSEFSNNVMVALLPTKSDWCKIELPHLTLVYVGKLDDLKPTTFNDLAKAALTLALATRSLELDVLNVDVLGDEDKVEAFLLRPTPTLLAMRSVFDSWNASKYTDYLPHATIGPLGSFDGNKPNTMTFDRILVSWGDKNLVFKLLTGEPTTV